MLDSSLLVYRAGPLFIEVCHHGNLWCMANLLGGKLQRIRYIRYVPCSICTVVLVPADSSVAIWKSADRHFATWQKVSPAASFTCTLRGKEAAFHLQTLTIVVMVQQLLLLLPLVFLCVTPPFRYLVSLCVFGCACLSSPAANPPEHLKTIHNLALVVTTYTLAIHSTRRQIVQFPTVVTLYCLLNTSLNSSSRLIESCLTPCSPVLQMHPLWRCLPPQKVLERIQHLQ